MFQSTSGVGLSNKSMSLTYGSAKLTGFLWKDYACLQPLNLPESASNLTNSTVLASISDKHAKDYNIQREKRFLQEAYEFQNENKCSHF